MANLKNGTIREMVIDRCLSDQEHQYSTQDIMEACNKTLKTEGFQIVTALNTIRSDMRMIEEQWGAYGGRIIEERQGRNKYYHYEDPSFSIYQKGMTEQELHKLNQTIQLLHRFLDKPQYNWLGETLARFQSCFMMPNTSHSPICFGEETHTALGGQWVAQLLEAITAQQVLCMTFQLDAQSATKVYTIHPYYLHKTTQGWYLMGWNATTQMIEVWPVTTLRNFHETSETFQPCQETNLDQCFATLLQQRQPQTNVQTIRLWISPQQRTHLELFLQQVHPQEVEQREDGSAVIILQTAINEKLVKELLACAEDVVVLQPASLRKQIQDHIWITGEHYAKIQ